MKRRAVVVDLDGALSSHTWRLQWARNGMDEDTFHRLLKWDRPVKWVWEFMRTDHGNAHRLLITSRPEVFRGATNLWLDRYAIHPNFLLMRPSDSELNDTMNKEALIRDYIWGMYDVSQVITANKELAERLRVRGLYVIHAPDPDVEPLKPRHIIEQVLNGERSSQDVLV